MHTNFHGGDAEIFLLPHRFAAGPEDQGMPVLLGMMRTRPRIYEADIFIFGVVHPPLEAFSVLGFPYFCSKFVGVASSLVSLDEHSVDCRLIRC